jgi:multiple antibiotic resistance protein
MNESYVYTIFFLLLGPLKIIPDFLKLTRGTDSAFKRDLAIKASLFSSVIVFFVAFTGRKTILKYQL